MPVVVGPAQGAFEEHILLSVGAESADLVDQRDRFAVDPRGELVRCDRVDVGEGPLE